MILDNIFKPSYSEQEKECLGMNFSSPVGVRVDLPNGAKYVGKLQKRCFSYSIINCSDISYSISELKKIPRKTNIIAHLDKLQTWTYNGNEKSILSAFALLYDFVDAFVISGFDELSDDIDQMLYQRMYNDEYRPILMEIPDSILLDELKQIISYARLSKIDGLIISNPRLLEHAMELAGGSLTLIYENTGKVSDFTGIGIRGADLLCLSAGRNPMNSVCKGRKLIRQLHKLSL